MQWTRPNNLSSGDARHPQNGITQGLSSANRWVRATIIEIERRCGIPVPAQLAIIGCVGFALIWASVQWDQSFQRRSRVDRLTEEFRRVEQMPLNQQTHFLKIVINEAETNGITYAEMGLDSAQIHSLVTKARWHDCIDKAQELQEGLDRLSGAVAGLNEYVFFEARRRDAARASQDLQALRKELDLLALLPNDLREPLIRQTDHLGNALEAESQVPLYSPTARELAILDRVQRSVERKLERALWRGVSINFGSVEMRRRPWNEYAISGSVQVDVSTGEWTSTTPFEAFIAADDEISLVISGLD